MLTFGYQNKFSGPFKALLAIAFGVFLLVTHANAMKLVVQIISVCVFVYGVFSLVFGIRSKSSQILSTSAVINIAVSLLLFTFAGPVSAVIRYILGSLLFLLGLYQTLVLFSARNEMKAGVVPFVLPVVIMLAGGLFFSKELIGNDMLGVLAGVAFITFGISELLASFKISKILSEAEKKKNQPEENWMKIERQSAKDVDYEKVTDK